MSDTSVDTTSTIMALKKWYSEMPDANYLVNFEDKNILNNTFYSVKSKKKRIRTKGECTCGKIMYKKNMKRCKKSKAHRKRCRILRKSRSKSKKSSRSKSKKRSRSRSKKRSRSKSKKRSRSKSRKRSRKRSKKRSRKRSNKRSRKRSKKRSRKRSKKRKSCRYGRKKSCKSKPGRKR